METRLDYLPRDVQRLIVALVSSPGNLRNSCRELRGVVDGCNTRLSFCHVDDARAPTSEAVLSLLQRTPHLASLRIQRWWPNVQWATVLAACPGLRTLDFDRCSLEAIRSALEACQSLHFWDCKELADMRALVACTGLQSLQLEGCHMVADMSALAACFGLLGAPEL